MSKGVMGNKEDKLLKEITDCEKIEAAWKEFLALIQHSEFNNRHSIYDDMTHAYRREVWPTIQSTYAEYGRIKIAKGE